MQLEALRLLADSGQPLNLEVKTQGSQHLIRRDGGPWTEHVCWNPREDLQLRLAHYPRDAWINGEKLETSPAPTLAEVMVLQPSGRDTSGDIERRLDLGEPERHIGFNALIGGVWGTIQQGNSTEESSAYFSPMPGESRHHRLLAVVRLNPHLEVQADEIEMLKQAGSFWEFRMKPELRQRTERRMEEMLERTMLHPEMPARYEGRVYSCPLVGHRNSREYVSEAPVAVLGTPVTIGQESGEMSSGEFISIVEALYDSDSRLVPVNEEPEQMGPITVPGAGPETAMITAAEPVIMPEGAERPAEIVLKLQMEDWEEDRNGELEVPARFWITGDPGENLSVRAVPGRISPQELRDVMLRALWDEEEYSSGDYADWAREEMEEKLHNLARHHLEEGSQAVLQELQWAADRFESMVQPLPNQQLSATSRDGRITIILNPAGAGG